ncbi:MAG: VWA domain-containing protein [Oscillospiraceae bacterium]|nr:VWA domain-containing protein [Oscillospiraceae bacterium]
MSDENKNQASVAPEAANTSGNAAEPETAKEDTRSDSLLDFDDDDPLSATAVSKKTLVIFFLIDTSGSMKGKKMGELNTVMEELIPEIRRVGEADTDVKIAVLTFSTNVRWMYSQPVSIENFEWARLRADGVTSMGEAFKELAARMSRNSFMSSPSLSFAPVIFLMTDGYPSDDYKEGLAALQANSWYKFGLKAALGIGNEANDDMLAEFTESKDTVVHAYSGNQLANMIKIVAVTASQIGSKSMTLSDESNQELSEEDVYASKQKQLGKQIQELVGKSNDTNDVPFDTGW